MTPAITVSHVDLSYGTRQVLHDVNLVVEPGTVTAVLGPSGCGKTSLLRAIAGLVRPSAGRITLGEHVIDDSGVHIGPEHRGIGMVPQEGALFPHLDVFGNVGFALPGSKSGKRVRVEELLDLVGMGGSGARRPQELSGGMQQRIAVARALSRRPQVVLLDEPFSALDAGLREEVRNDVLAAIRADGATVLLVTHDQDEALSCADRVAVMREGSIVQEGSPQDVYMTPADLDVARFVGACVELPVTIATHEGKANLATALGEFMVPASDVPSDPIAVWRPEELVFSAHLGIGGPGRAVAVRYHGHDRMIAVQLEAGPLVTVRAQGADAVRIGDLGMVSATRPPRLFSTDAPQSLALSSESPNLPVV
jgi:iron(III) transport system ATP-binding protein